MAKSFISKLTAGLFIMVISLKANACLNEYYFNKDSAPTGWDGDAPVFYSDHDSVAARAFLNKYDLDHTEKYDFTYQSDIAVKLAYLGEYKRSLNILIRLEKAHPEEYTIAANLGTLYELIGDNESALKFIRKGIALNPGAHEGSEWVHVKILEAKLKIKKNPAWIFDHSVLGTGITFESKLTGSIQRQKQLADIVYQLKERLPFTSFPDPIIANIFNELGDLYAVEASAEMAYVSYELSSENNGDELYGLKKKESKLAIVIRENGVPVPDWHFHYRSVYDNESGAYLKSKLAEAEKNPEQTINKIGEFKSMVTNFYHQDEKKDNTPLYVLITVLTVLGAGFVFFIYRRPKSK